MNSKRRCSYCKRSKPAKNMLIQGIQAFCDKECFINYAGSNVSSLVKKGEKIQRQKHAQRKREFKLNDRQLRKKAAQNAFNAFIRLRDKKEPCISCEKPNDGSHQRHASHFRSVGSCSTLRFNEDNVHASCSVCNNHLSGNIAEYRVALIKKIGLEKVGWIESQPRVKKFTCEELKQIELYYKDKIKQLKAAA